MSSAPSTTASGNSPAADHLSETQPATPSQPTPSATTEATTPPTTETLPASGGAATGEAAAHELTNPELNPFDITLAFADGTPIRWNNFPLNKHDDILITVKLKNKPGGGVTKMIMTVIVSELSKSSTGMECGSGRFFKNVRSTTYQESVPIVTDASGHSITIRIAEDAESDNRFHGGDGPYDMHVSFAPDLGTAAEIDGDYNVVSQIDETLRYSFFGTGAPAPSPAQPVE